MRTLADHARALATGSTSARALVEACLARIADPAGEGARAFVAVHADRARAMADAMDARRRAGQSPGPYAGIPLAVKDLFDIAGEPTRAGAAVLADAAPATAHAPAVARLLSAGFVPVGRTNMTEFAFSGLGINPHHGTPLSPWDRAGRRIPGGSSSGSAVAVADGMAAAALGTDTGGSCRIPASLCGVVGYKPTARLVPLDGVLPLSPSLDSVGPIAASVGCCATLHGLLSGTAPIAAVSLAGLALAVPTNVVWAGVDAAVAAAFARALDGLGRAGARITQVAFAALDDIAPVNAAGGLAAAEAHAWHRRHLPGRAAEYDPFVASRIARGAAQSAADYLDILAARRDIAARMDEATAGFDALLLPASPLIPPRLADLADPAEAGRINALLLRNTALANFLDRCAISLPCQSPGDAPVGLMLMGETLGDARLLAIAAAVEAAIAQGERG